MSEPRSLETLVHDVKTPLATIRALSQLTASQLRAKGEDALALRLEKIDAQIERIRTLLANAVEGEHRAG